MQDDDSESNYKKIVERTRKLLGYDEPNSSTSDTVVEKGSSNNDK